jgi:uncharacterized protein
MLKEIAERRVEIAEICRRFGVQRLEVFGSAARGGDFDPTRSDIDVLVEFHRETQPPSLDHFFRLEAELASLFGRRVDLVMAGAIRNPFVKSAIDGSRELLFAA